MPHAPQQSVACLPAIDVAIVGGSTAAVSAALELAENGSSTTLFHSRSGLGEESAGTLQPVPASLDRADSWVDSLYPQDAPFPVWPGRIRRGLEQALLRAGVPFWFFVRPVSLLLDESGQMAGLLMASRSALFAVPCRAVIDASQHGIVARLARVPLTNLREEQWSIRFLAKTIPAGWEDRVQPLGDWFEVSEGKTVLRAGLFEARLPSPGDKIEPAASEWRLRSELLDPTVCVTPEALSGVGSAVAASPETALATQLDHLQEAQFEPKRGLFCLNTLLPIETAVHAEWEHPNGQATLGRRLGQLVASRLPTVGPPVQLPPSDTTGHHGFAPIFLRKSDTEVTLDLAHFPRLTPCDVVVAGGGTGGAGAAIAAAREGARTIVCDIQHGLGGVGTLGLIASYYFGNRCGFTSELDDRMAKLDSSQPDTKRWNPELKMALYARLLKQAGGEAWLNSFAFGVRKAGQKVDGVLVSTPFGAGLVQCGAVVDATGSADVAAAAGAPCRTTDGSHVAVQGTGLSPRLIEPRYHNTDHTFIDDGDPEGVTYAFVEARAKFPEAFDTAPFVDSRERRQIRGEFELSPLDFLANRTFPDTITTAESNFDTHGFTVHPVFLVCPPDKKSLRADVPFRCLLPRDIEGVLATGLGVSAHRDALPVIRMQADVQNQGCAAGIAAAWSAQRGVAYRELDIREIQKKLVELGVLAPAKLQENDSFPLPKEVVKTSVEKGPVTFYDAAILFAHEAESQPLLLEKLTSDITSERAVDAALVLGLMGHPAAGDCLAGQVAATEWDDGWNYRGMGQFGRSMSRLDALIVALAKTHHAEAATIISAKVAELDQDAALSHCRAAALAAGILREPPLAEAIHQLLQRPGLAGHAITAMTDGVQQANPDKNDNRTRNLALRELHLARGLYLAGDHEALGRGILEIYSQDLRGLFARHARAVMNRPEEAAVG